MTAAPRISPAAKAMSLRRTRPDSSRRTHAVAPDPDQRGVARDDPGGEDREEPRIERRGRVPRKDGQGIHGREYHEVGGGQQGEGPQRRTAERKRGREPERVLRRIDARPQKDRDDAE